MRMQARRGCRKVFSIRMWRAQPGIALTVLLAVLMGNGGVTAQTWPPTSRPGVWDFLDGFPRYDPFYFGISAAAYDNNGDLVAGGTMQSGANAAARLQRWSAGRWTSFGDRLVNEAGGTGVAEILAIAVATNGDILVGGRFTLAYNSDGSSVVSTGIVRWEAASNTWKSVGQGVGGFGTPVVRSIVPGPGGTVFVGGTFQQGTNDDGSPVSMFNVGRWNPGAQSWEGLGDGLSSTVNALTIDIGGDLIAGGWFQNSGGSIPLNHLGRWNGSQWSSVGSGVNTIVDVARADPSGNIYISPGDYVRGGLLRWTIASARWDTLAGGENFDHPIWLDIRGNGDAYLAYARGAPLYSREVARWSGGVKTLLASFGGGGTPLVIALDQTFPGVRLFMGGAYTSFLDVVHQSSMNFTNAAVWNGTDWFSLQTLLPPGSVVKAVTPFQRFVGGEFSFVDKDLKQGSNIATYEHLTRLWRRVGGGTNAAVLALAEIDNAGGPGVVVGGAFTLGYDADNHPVPLSRVATWNLGGTGGWEALGQGVDDTVYAVELTGSFADTAYVYVGGTFTRGINTDGSEVFSPCIIRWNTATALWEPVGNGLTGGQPSRVRAIAAVRPALSRDAIVYVGGSFAGPFNGSGSADTALNIVEWNGATGTWSPLGKGLDGEVYALRHSGSPEPWADLLWVGGDFTASINEFNLGLSTRHVASWNRPLRRWEQVGHGVNGAVRAIAGNTYPIFGGDFDGVEDGDGTSFYSSHIALFAPSPIYPVTKEGWNRFGIGSPLSVHALAFTAPCDQYSGEIVSAGMEVPAQGGYGGGIVAEWRYIYTPQAGSFILDASTSTGPSCAPGQCTSVVDILHHTCPAPTSLRAPVADNGLAPALHFGEFTGLDNLPVGSPITMTVYDSANVGVPLATFEVVRASEAPSAFLLTGLFDSSGFALNPDGRATRLAIVPYPMPVDSLDTGAVALLCVNAATDAPMIGILSQSDGDIADSLRYGDGGPGRRVSPSAHQMEIRRTSTGEVLGTFIVDLTGKGGSVVALTVAGFVNPSVNQNGPSLRLILSDPGIRLVTSVGLQDKPSSGPAIIRLDQNFPNPFNPATVIQFELPVRSQVQLTVYDVLGRVVATLLHEVREAGRHRVVFDGRGLATGMYLYRLQAGLSRVTKTMMAIK